MQPAARAIAEQESRSMVTITPSAKDGHMQHKPDLQVKLNEASYLDGLEADPDVLDVTAERLMEELAELPDPPDDEEDDDDEDDDDWMRDDPDVRADWGVHPSIDVRGVLLVGLVLLVLGVAALICLVRQW